MADASTIGLICAIPQERVDLRAALEHDERLEIGGFGFDRGRLDGRAVVLAEAGIGKVNTAAVATLLADRFAARTLVFSGVAGGLDPDLAIGDVVIAERAIQHDAGVIENERLHPYQAGHVPFFNPTPELGYRVDPPLLERVRDRLHDLELAPLSAAAGGTGGGPSWSTARFSRAISSSTARRRASGCTASFRPRRWRWRARRSLRSRSAWAFPGSRSARCPTSPARTPASTSPSSSRRSREAPP